MVKVGEMEGSLSPEDYKNSGKNRTSVEGNFSAPCHEGGKEHGLNGREGACQFAIERKKGCRKGRGFFARGEIQIEKKTLAQRD